jgi:hypothetical protein
MGFIYTISLQSSLEQGKSSVGDEWMWMWMDGGMSGYLSTCTVHPASRICFRDASRARMM